MITDYSVVVNNMEFISYEEAMEYFDKENN